MAFGTIRLKKPRAVVLNRSTRLLLLVFILIFVSNDTFMFGTNSNTLMVEIPRVLLGLYIVYELMRWLVTKEKKYKVFIVGQIMVALMIIISLYHGDPVKLIIIKCLCILSGLFLTIHYEFEEYAEAFSKVMLFLAVMSLILECIAYLFPSLVYVFPRMINTANNEITTIGLAGFATEYMNTNIIRAFGIFWEPGVYHMYLNLALMIELFQKREINWRNIIILVLNVFITFSTTGYIVTAWIIITYFCLEQKETVSRKNLMTTCLIFAGLIVIFLVFDFSFINELVFSKLGDSEDGNWIARSASVFVNLDIFFDYPVLGVGMNRINEEFIRRSATMYSRLTIHNTNTLLYQFAAHGIFYAGLFMVGTLKFPKCISNKKAVVAALAMALVLMYIGENLRYSIFPFVLIFYGYQRKSPVNTVMNYEVNICD